MTEGALVAQLHEVGKVPMAAASATTILVRFATLWFAVLVGFGALSILKRRYPKLMRDIKEADAVLDALPSVTTAEKPPVTKSEITKPEITKPEITKAET